MTSPPVALAAGDFNGDGKRDLAVIVSTPLNDSLEVFLGNGDGSFQPAVVIGPTCDFTHQTMAAADVNVDGKSDIVVSCESAISVYLNNGDGTFKLPVFAPTGTLGTDSFAIADFNADHLPDIVVGTGHNATVLLGRGDGTFPSSVVFPFPAGNFVSVVTGDFNGDGKTDFAASISYYDSYICSRAACYSYAQVFLGDGAGGFQAAAALNFGKAVRVLAAGDLNGDGRSDLVVADTYSQVLYTVLGNSDGTLSQAAFTFGFDLIGGTVADLNGDGMPDILVAAPEGRVAVFAGDGTGSLGPETSYALPGYFASSRVTFAVDDWNNDGKRDIVGAAWGGYPLYALAFLAGNGDGSFRGLGVYAADQMPSPTSFDVADLDGDGYADLAIANNGSVGIAYGNGNGAFAPAVVVLAQGGNAVLARDLNGDGRPDLLLLRRTQDQTCDLILAITAYLATPSGYSLAGNGAAVCGFRVTFVVDDFNRDGKLDVAVLTDTQLLIILGNGDGTFKAPQPFSPGGGTVLGGLFLASADANADGIPDLIVPGVLNSSSGVGVFMGNGDGTFQLPLTSSLPFEPRVFAAADVNGDGKADIVGGYGNGAVLLGDGTGNFTQSATFTLPLAGGDLGMWKIAVDDVNGDGKPDIVCTAGIRPMVFVVAGIGDGTFQLASAGYFAGSAATDSALLLGRVNGRATAQQPADVLLTSSGGITVLVNENNPSNPVQKQSAFVAIDSNSSAVVAGQSVTFSSTVSRADKQIPTGSVTFIDGAAALATVALDAQGKATYVAASLTRGTHAMVAGYTGDSTTTAGRSAAATISVTDPVIQVSPASVSFGGVLVGTSSAALSVSISNPNPSPVSIAIIGITVSAAFTQTNTCDATLAPGATCSVSVTYKPTGTGAQSGSLTISHSAAGGQTVVVLHGTGQDFSLSATTTSATVNRGQSATYSVSATAAGGYAGILQLSCSGAPPLGSCIVSPTSADLSASGTATLTVTATTSATGTVASVEPLGPSGAAVVIAVLSLLSAPVLFAAAVSRRRRFVAGGVAVFATCIGLIGCGGGSSTSTTLRQSGTPAGTYTLTVNATSGGVTKAQNLTVVVNP